MKKRRHGHKNRPLNLEQEVMTLRRIITFLKTYCLPNPKDYQKFVNEIMANQKMMPFKERQKFVQNWIEDNTNENHK